MRLPSSLQGKRANYFLHAWRMDFHDSSQGIEAPIPEIFLHTLKKIFAVDEKEVYSLLRQSKI
jgi:hypothetical protein